eukprot:ANDGO_06700.mRNA.1 Protein kinase 2
MGNKQGKEKGESDSDSGGVVSIDSGSGAEASNYVDPSMNAISLNPDSATSLSYSKLSVDDFELLRVLGQGSFGKVLLVRKRDNGKVYAMKVIKKGLIAARDQIRHTLTERAILIHSRHPFLVRLHFAFQSSGKLYLVLEYVNGGELFFHLKREGRFAERRAGFYAAEIVLALLYLHSHDVLYRDLKPENVLLGADGHIRLTDFGLAKMDVQEEPEGQGRTHSFCGTPEYLAPEVLRHEARGKAMDWWSLGTLMYEMMVGVPPFYDENLQNMYSLILYGELVFPPFLSVHAQSLLRGLLDRDPSKRLGGEDVRNHPFFQYIGIDWNMLMAKKIPAPFMPRTRGEDDADNFDEEFTKMTPQDSVVQESSLDRNEDFQAQFNGFTYTSPDMTSGKTPRV